MNNLKIFVLGFVLGIIFTYSGLIGFSTGLITGIFINKNLQNEEDWTVLDTENKNANFIDKIKQTLELISKNLFTKQDESNNKNDI